MRISNNSIEDRISNFGKLAQSKYKKPDNSDFKYSKRTWPDKDIDKSPVWCSVDLRDGNQALEKPMTVEQKMEYFNIMIQMGFKEIEVGFPASGGPDYDFIRKLIDDNLIPDNVKIQVLTQCREDTIQKTRECVDGAKNVIIHLYNSTSTIQREVVFNKSKDEIIQLAENGVDLIKEKFSDFNGNLQFEYSPESFTGTEVRFAKKICESVINKWDNFKGEKIIINLPATVENSTPDRYADKIEYIKKELSIFTKKIKDKVGFIISVHTHNDRGTGVAATELAIKAGAERVEGVIGVINGERSGNVDIGTVGLNMFTQGVSPNLDLSSLGEVAKQISEIINIPIHPKYPYIGEDVHTAYSGSHQDAISKGMKRKTDDGKWNVPYLPIDPQDIGEEYEPIKINSQSGKGGMCYVLEQFGYKLPREHQPGVSKIFQSEAEKINGELHPSIIKKLFEDNYVNKEGQISISPEMFDTIKEKGRKQGIGPTNALSNYISDIYDIEFKILEYKQCSEGPGREANAITYFEIEINGNKYIGYGKDFDSERSVINGLISCLNIAIK